MTDLQRLIGEIFLIFQMPQPSDAISESQNSVPSTMIAKQLESLLSEAMEEAKSEEKWAEYYFKEWQKATDAYIKTLRPARTEAYIRAVEAKINKIKSLATGKPEWFDLEVQLRELVKLVQEGKCQ